MTKPTNIETLMTVPEAARQIGISRQGAAWAIAEGNLRGVTIAGRVLISPAEVARFKRARAKRAKAGANGKRGT
ncbi:MAG: helix-turn-helix domain-containing protein [Candidatus Nanopelagicales bacterium]|nr:helix-turn-helix domain-containing protein [Candidatus Nanopelagicales bacterium]